MAEKGLEFIKKLDQYGGITDKLIEKNPDTTSPDYGVYPWERSIEEYIKFGVIPLDKPPGPTSHEVVAWIKRMFNLSKAGHGGTLDPKVTGMLPVALEEATKIIGLVVHTGKEYICVMQLHEPVKEEDLYQVLKLFVGEIYQRPPLRSSVKRSLRTKTVYRIDILEYNTRYALLHIESSPGTYMRKICHDAGLLLGVGAHMRELRRIRSGPFHEDKGIVRLQELSEALYRWRNEGKDDLLRKLILPAEYAVSHLRKIIVRDTAVDAIAHGANLAVPGIAYLHEGINKGELVAILTLKGELVAIGTAKMNTKQIIESSKGVAVKIRRVTIKPGIYPSVWKKQPRLTEKPS